MLQVVTYLKFLAEQQLIHGLTAELGLESFENTEFAGFVNAVQFRPTTLGTMDEFPETGVVSLLYMGIAKECRVIVHSESKGMDYFSKFAIVEL